MNENKNTIYQKLQDAEKAVFSGKITAVNTYIKEEEIFQTNTLKLIF